MLILSLPSCHFRRRRVREGAAFDDEHRRQGTLMANQLGKMYLCGKCGSQVIVTKGGSGSLKCCGQEMEQKK